MRTMAQPNWHRTCVGCGQARHKKELLRIVISQDNHPEIDFKQNKPGRGTYVCPNLNCAKLAKRKRGLDRSLRLEVGERFYNYLIQQAEQLELRKS